MTPDDARAEALSLAAKGELARFVAQLTLDGREEALDAVLRASEVFTRPVARPEPLFAQEAFSARVPGTIAMDTDHDG